jgi:threonine dehydratase
MLALEGSPPMRVDADGLAILPPTSCRAHIESCLVSEHEIRRAKNDLWSEMRLAVEPAAALLDACLRTMLLDQIAEKRISVLICGANVDPSTLGLCAAMV